MDPLPPLHSHTLLLGGGTDIAARFIAEAEEPACRRVGWMVDGGCADFYLCNSLKSSTLSQKKTSVRFEVFVKLIMSLVS